MRMQVCSHVSDGVRTAVYATSRLSSGPFTVELFGILDCIGLISITASRYLSSLPWILIVFFLDLGLSVIH